MFIEKLFKKHSVFGCVIFLFCFSLILVELLWYNICGCRYLDQFGKTKVHTPICPFYGHPNPPAPCPCPLRQAWGSLDALIGRLRAAFEENGGKQETNPFGARAVRLYLREVRDLQSKARGISYEKKKRKRPPPQQQQQSMPLLPPPPHHHHHHHLQLPPPGATHHQ